MLISADTQKQNARGRGMHGVNGPLLADPDNKVTDLYNLLTTRNVTPKAGIINDLPIPTTFLVDETGIIKWLDQAEDYMWRSDPTRVLAAIDSSLASIVQAESAGAQSGHTK